MICNYIDEYYENKDPYIQIYKHALPSDICKEIIKSFEENYDKQYHGRIISGIDLTVKITKEMRIDSEPLNVYDNILFENLHTYLEKYIEKYIKTTNCKGIIFDTGYQIQKYKVNEGFYKIHTDAHSTIKDNEAKQRMITYLWYLNNVEEGGETLFEDFKIKPIEGTLLLFPATWTYPHSGSIPKSNDKYIITGWIYN